nr:NAD-dependent epimerase/dehydratase family protein [uncultured Schaedlerella sp.]
MNIALLGSSGYIAEYLIEKLEKEKEIEKILRIGRTDLADIYLELQEAENFPYDILRDIDYIIFTAAISGPDQCASEFSYCWKVNVTGTIYFITEAIQRGCRVLFFSSDAVFGDIPGKIYTEDSETKAVTPYGRMKKAVEDQFKNEGNFKALRLPYVVSVKDRFVSYCLECISKDEEAEVFHPLYRNCVGIDDVARTVFWLVTRWEEYQEPVLNIAGKELISRVRIADELNRYLGGRLKYTIVSPGSSFYKNRPKITQMSSMYIQRYHILEDNSFSEKIKKELEGIIDEY